MILLVALAIAAVPDEGFEKLGQEVVGIVKDRFYDAERGREWSAKHGRYAAEVRDRDEFAALTNRLLGEFHASHTRFFTPDEVEYYGLQAIFQGVLSLGERKPLGLKDLEYDSIGADYSEGRFLRRVFPGGMAEDAGLRRGDEILEADGLPFHPIRSFRGTSGQDVTLQIRRHADGAPMQIRVRPRKVSPGVEWQDILRLGSKVVTRGGRKVAYAPIYSCAGIAAEEELRLAILGSFQGADALILDLRDGWGGCTPTFLDLFNPTTPVLASVDRDGRESRLEPAWKKPLVILINGRSRSGKEMVAFAIKKHGLGTLVGERTGGAVLAGAPFRLSDGSLLYLAIADVRVDGERLEGRGVEPDVMVEDRLPYADGADPQLEKALDIAVEKAGGVKKG